MEEIVIYWSRRDFRIADNPALSNAVLYAEKKSLKFLPLFIIDKELLNNAELNIGFPRRKYLSKALAQFAVQFDRFVIANGKPYDVFTSLSKSYKLHVHCNDDIEPYAINRDSDIQKLVTSDGGSFRLYNDQTSIDTQVKTGNGHLYSVFTPFKKRVLCDFINLKALHKPDFTNLSYLKDEIHIDIVYDVNNHTHLNEIQQSIFNIIDTKWVCIIGESAISLDNLIKRNEYSEWYLSEQDFLDRFDSFLEDSIQKYNTNRDDLSLEANTNRSTSRASVALKWGLTSPRIIITKIRQKFGDRFIEQPGIESYTSELIWREFYRYILFHNQDVLNQEYQTKYRNKIDWVDLKHGLESFEKWIRAETGYPMVDAFMNQISSVGWMHNRGRMVTASFLTKHLGIDWRWGQSYFRSVLIDLDEASNNGGWQWAASVGADPKPMRIFNPYLQADRYDPDKSFRSKWLGTSYSQIPIVDHKEAREQALKRYSL